MPKAVFIQEHGGPEAFRMEEAETPASGADEIVVRNAAIGLNFIDIYQRKGLYPVALPAVLGGEGAGRVIAVGDDVTAFKPGDRVAYLSSGAYREESAVPAAMAARLPESISAETAAAVFLKGLTAHMLVRQIYPLSKGKSALVYAAAGGVGTLLTQWAARLGADVIAVVGDEKKAALAKSYGAKGVILRTQTDSIAAEVRRLTGGRGVDVAYDSVGEKTFEASLDSLAMRGMMVSYGNASGPVPAVAPLELSRRGSLFLTRPTLFHYATPERLAKMAEELFAAISSGELKPAEPAVFALGDVAEAHRLLESGRSAGPIILKP